MYLGPLITELLNQIATIHNENMEEQNTKDRLYDLEKELDAELKKVFGSNGLEDNKWNNTIIHRFLNNNNNNNKDNNIKFIPSGEKNEDYSFIIQPKHEFSVIQYIIKYASSRKDSVFSQDSKGIQYCEVPEDLVFYSGEHFIDDGLSLSYEGSGYGCVSRVKIPKGFYLSIGCFNVLLPLSCLSIYISEYYHCSCYNTEEAWEEPINDDGYENISPSDLAICFYNADKIKSNMAKKYIKSEDYQDIAYNSAVSNAVDSLISSEVYNDLNYCCTIYKINN